MAEDDDVLLTYEMHTRFPTKRGNVRLQVSRNGDVRWQRNDVDPPPGEDWTAPLPAEPQRHVRFARFRIERALRKIHLFDDAAWPTTAEAVVSDGTESRIVWRGDSHVERVAVGRAGHSVRQVVARLGTVPF